MLSASNDELLRQQRNALEEASRLCKRDAQEGEPYAHFYSARTVLQTQRDALEQRNNDQSPLIVKLLGQLDARLGSIALDVEEPHVADDSLRRALSILAPGCEALGDEALDDAERLALTQRLSKHVDLEYGGTEALRQAALLWDQRGQTRRARLLLETAEAANGEETATTFLLAQVYVGLGLRELSAEYCRRTLETETDLPAKEWVKNALGLSAYYVSEGKRDQALALALKAHRVAHDNFANATDEGSLDLCADAHIHIARAHASRVEDSAACRRRTDFIEARRHFAQARQRYVLDGFVTEHVGICRDESQLWASLEANEIDARRKIAMCQRRADLLEPLREALNPRVYADLRCALAFELGQIWSRALDLKEPLLEPACSKAKLRTSRLFRDRAVQAYDDFIFCCSLDHRDESKRLTATDINVDDIGPFLRAQFSAARLQSKLFGDTQPRGRELNADSLARFKQAKQDALAAKQQHKLPDDFFKDELKLCDEMIALLPTKIDQSHYNNVRLPSDH